MSKFIETLKTDVSNNKFFLQFVGTIIGVIVLLRIDALIAGYITLMIDPSADIQHGSLAPFMILVVIVVEIVGGWFASAFFRSRNGNAS